jgi:hypothetical protein
MRARCSIVRKDDIRDHNRAGDRTAARLGARHAHVRMAVDDGFDLLGMNLQTADIDDAASPADEVITVTAEFHHIAGVDKSVRNKPTSLALSSISMAFTQAEQ